MVLHHATDWEHVEVLDQESVDRHIIIQESLQINRDLGLEVSQANNGTIKMHIEVVVSTKSHPGDITIA